MKVGKLFVFSFPQTSIRKSREKMFRVKKFLCCFKIEIAGYACVLDDLIISLLSGIIATNFMKQAPYIKEHPDLEKPLRYLIYLYSAAELIAALLVFVALIKVIFAKNILHS